MGPSLSRGGRLLQRSTSATVNGDCSTSSSGVRDWVAKIEMLFNYAMPRWWSESYEEKRKLQSCENFTACIHSLAKLAISNINVYRANQ